MSNPKEPSPYEGPVPKPVTYEEWKTAKNMGKPVPWGDPQQVEDPSEGAGPSVSPGKDWSAYRPPKPQRLRGAVRTEEEMEEIRRQQQADLERRRAEQARMKVCRFYAPTASDSGGQPPPDYPFNRLANIPLCGNTEFTGGWDNLRSCADEDYSCSPLDCKGYEEDPWTIEAVADIAEVSNQLVLRSARFGPNAVRNYEVVFVSGLDATTDDEDVLHGIDFASHKDETAHIARTLFDREVEKQQLAGFTVEIREVKTAAVNSYLATVTA